MFSHVIPCDYTHITGYNFFIFSIIRDLFLTALSTQPSIVIIDDLECLSEPNETESEVPRRLRTELLLGIDSIHRTGELVGDQIPSVYSI